ncbi:MAG: prephenate dehydrogenase/arogenate dehydrogenase family protein, partial [Dehalococcoidia bacterium]
MERITIIGLGLIGGSLGLALKAAKLMGVEIVGYDKDTPTAGEARRLRVVDKSEPILQRAVRDARLVIIATPIRAIRGVMEEIAGELRENCVVTDTASTNTALSTGWLDMSSLQRAVTRSVYVMVLKKDLPSALAPESDEEKPKEAEKSDKDKQADKGDKDQAKQEKPVTVEIDLENISQRILALPIPARNYQQLEAGKPGVLYLVEGPPVDPLEFEDGPPTLTVHKFDLKTRKTEKILEGVTSFHLSFNGEKMLYARQNQWTIGPAEKAPEGPPPPEPKPGQGGPLKLDQMEVYVDPRAEWKHM